MRAPWPRRCSPARFRLGWLLLLCLSPSGCTKTGSLVVVTLDAAPPLPDVARLHVNVTAGGQHRTFEVPPASGTIPPKQSFGIDVGDQIRGLVSVEVTAYDSAAAPVGVVSGAIAIASGQRVDLALDFASSGDGGVPGDQATAPLAWDPQTIGASALAGVWGADAQHLYAVGSGAAIYFSSGDGTWAVQASAPMNDLTAVWGSSPADVYAADAGGLVRHSRGDGQWTVFQTAGALRLTAIWGVGATNVFVAANGGAAAGGAIFHSTTADNAWPAAEGVSLYGYNGLWGAGPSVLYAVGESGQIGRSSGDGKWTQTSSGASARLRGVWGAGELDLFVVGDAGTILHSTGDGTWQPQTVPVAAAQRRFFAVWGAGAGDVYVVGEGGLILHSAGDGVWTELASGVDPAIDLQAIWGSGPRDLYVVGSSGLILHGH